MLGLGAEAAGSQREGPAKREGVSLSGRPCSPSWPPRGPPKGHRGNRPSRRDQPLWLDERGRSFTERAERSEPSCPAAPEAREAALMWESAEVPMSAIGTSTTRSRAHGRTDPVSLLPDIRTRREGSSLTPAGPHRAYPPCERSLGIEVERDDKASYPVSRGVGPSCGGGPHLPSEIDVLWHHERG